MLKLNYRILRQKIDTFPIPVNYDLIEERREIEVSQPIYLTDDLDRIIGSPFGITIQQEIDELSAQTYSSGPFYQYQLENILLLKNRIYFDKYEYMLNPLEKAKRFYNSKDMISYSEAAFSSMRISTVFFGHWLHEELMLIDYLQGRGDIVTTSPMTPQKEEIKGLFNLQFNATPYAHIRSANMFEGWQHSSIYVEVLKKYKEKISFFSSDKKKINRPSVVYLKRGESAAKRNLTNENELLDSLSKDYDIKAYVAESTPIKQLYSEIYSADIILGVEGSQLAHGIIAGKPGAVLVCIQPPARFYNPFKNYCSDANIKYAFFVAEPDEKNDSFWINTERLKYFMNKVEHHLS